ncbi:MAG: F0F1 ATP synthase subunit B [Eubacteriaceae bacterium]|nr:F0F1 ATP synthase subunit B [Eubacteriaceae bacterium]
MESWLIRIDAELLKQAAIQLVTFLIYFVVVKKFFYDKINGIITKRKEMVAASLESAKSADEKAERLQKEYDEKVAAIENERIEIIRKAATDAQEVKDRIVGEAREQAGTIIENAKKEIEAEKAKAQEEFKDTIIEMTMNAAEKVVGKSLSREDHLDLINESISMFKEV